MKPSLFIYLKWNFINWGSEKLRQKKTSMINLILTSLLNKPFIKYFTDYILRLIEESL